MKKSKVIKQNVGCDFSKSDFKASFQQLLDGQRRRTKASRTFKNTVEGFGSFLNWAGKHRDRSVPVRVTVEATGVYHEQFVHFLNDDGGGWHTSILLPNKSKAYAKSLGVNTKTDKVDAKLLGMMGIERDLKKWVPISPKMYTIRQLCRERVSLLEERTSVSNKLHALSHSHAPQEASKGRMKERLELIGRQIKEAERDITVAVERDEKLKSRLDKVCKVNGIKLITAATVVSEMGGFVLFSSRSQVTSYAGYDIVERASGTSIRGKTKISKKGNRFVRRALHFPALTAVRHEPQFQQLYERVFERTSIKMKGYVAVQRKLLLLIYTLFKNDVEYDPDYQKKLAGQKENRQVLVPA